MASVPTASAPMIGGDGVYSYTQKSSFQSEGLQLAKFLIREAVIENLDVKQLLSSSKSFNIADLGCSTGPNTFSAVQNIVESVLSCKVNGTPSEEPVEFQVFFNDHIANDFNTLIKSLSPDRKYFAAAVPGPFQSRLFPKASIHFVHSLYSLHWLPKVPKEVVDRNSPTYNGGRIHYSNAPEAVREAFSAQFAGDMKSFWDARAQEVVSGGLMVVITLCTLDEVKPSHCQNVVAATALDTALLDMGKVGLVSEAKVDSFNIPAYQPTARELKASIEANGRFSIERMKTLVRPTEKELQNNIPRSVKLLRSIWEDLMKEHFKNEIIDELFDRLLTTLAESYDTSLQYYMAELFVLVKRNYTKIT